MQELLNRLQSSLIGVAETVVAYLPNLLAAIVLIIVGWLLARKTYWSNSNQSTARGSV